MIPEELLKKFPLKRIKPLDGMAVTAEIWEEAHNYHRLMHQFHNMLNHGAGILTGLNVIASDPPDRSVYILPGVAIDSWGRPIILSEPLSFDVGHTVEGLLYLLLNYGEGQPTRGRSNNGQEDTAAPRYIQTEFTVEARSDWPDSPSVELARLKRRGRDTPLFNAEDPEHPGPNELDLRFRREIGVVTYGAHCMAVTYLGGGGSTDTRHGTGANYMARTFTRLGRDKLYVDHNVSLSAELQNYLLLYLVARGPFQMSQDETNSLYAFLQAGGTILMESNRRNISGGGDAPADNAFFTLLSSLGVTLTEVRGGENLLTDPFLFGAPPLGYETLGAPRVLVGEGAIFSSFDYGAIWQGESRDGAAPREEIRAALEFGANIVTYALERRREANNHQ